MFGNQGLRIKLYKCLLHINLSPKIDKENGENLSPKISKHSVELMRDHVLVAGLFS